MNRAELLDWLRNQVAEGKRLSEIWQVAPPGVNLARIRRYLNILDGNGYGM